ncbi:MAG: serine/threonine protein kinase [Blastocatellia bacterium]|nr:serine/threonine protein kinase [Blastocatellia bacterium]
MLEPGRVLQNRYIILSQLGRGGMGTVYKARDQRLGNIVALKETFFNEESMHKAFEREAKILAGLRHKALPAVTDYFSEGGGQFLVMQYIEGDDLSTLMAKNSEAFSVDLVMKWAEQLLDVLDYMHTQPVPIVHRDIKPSNLKLTDRNEVILLDFGLAKGRPKNSSSQLASTGSVVGYTPNYAPPEQIEGTGTDPRSDIYAFAATIYHLLTDVKPADAFSRMIAVLNDKEDPLKPAEEVNPTIPKSISVILQKALMINKNKRPESAVQVSQLLKAIAVPTLVVSEPPEKIAASLSSPLPLPTLPLSFGDRAWPSVRYQPLKKVGQGGTGDVYLSMDTQTNKAVCLKLIQPQVDIGTIIQECRALMRLEHKNIGRILDFDIQPDPAKGSSYIVFEYIEGLSLAEYMTIHAPVAEPVVLMIARQVADALTYAQQHSVIHCDLKPANIIIEFNGRELIPKVVEFGLSIIDRYDDKSKLTGIGRFAGTPEYMSPEQVRGEVLTGQTDVYALGQIIWELLVGKSPYPSVYEMLRAKAEAKSGLRVRGKVSGVSEQLASLVEWATRPDPKSRPTIEKVHEIVSSIGSKVEYPVVAAPVNLSFEWNRTDIPGWFNSQGYVNNVSTQYQYSVVKREEPDAKGYCIKFDSAGASKEVFGSLMQRCPAKHLVGKRIRVEGRIQSKDVADWGGLWLRLDSEDNEPLYFYNMSDRPIRGTTPWITYMIETLVPGGTYWLNFGLLLFGEGLLWADEFKVVVADSTAKWRDFTLWQEGLQIPSL